MYAFILVEATVPLEYNFTHGYNNYNTSDKKDIK